MCLQLVLNTSGKPETSMESIKQPGDRTAQRQAQLTNNIESDQNQINSEQEPSERKTVENLGKKDTTTALQLELSKHEEKQERSDFMDM